MLSESDLFVMSHYIETLAPAVFDWKIHSPDHTRLRDQCDPGAQYICIL